MKSLSATSIFELVQTRVEHSDARAITSPRGSHSYSDVLAAAASLSDFLRAEHVPGIPVAVRIGDPFATAVTVLGCDHAGVPVIHSDPAMRNASPMTQLTDFPTDVTGSRCIGIANLVVTPGDSSLTLPTRSHAFMTSGSTGSPVGVVREASAVIADAERVAAFLGYAPDAPTLVTAPLFHVYGFNYGLIAPLLSGVPATYLPPRSLPSSICRAAQDARVLVALPFQYELITSSALPSLATAVSAGARLGSGVAAAIKSCGSLTLYNCYGSSEVGAATLMPVVGDEVDGDVGPPLPGVSVHIQNGELLLQSTSLARGRLTPEGISPLALCDGWYRTGDLARLSKGDHILLSGRMDAIINVAGKKVHPVEIERVLSAHPAVVFSQVGAEADKSRGQVPVVRLVLREDVSVIELMRWCRDRLAPHQRPRRIVVVDELPRSATGKVTNPPTQET